MDAERIAAEREFWDGYAGNYDAFIGHLGRAYRTIVSEISRHVDSRCRVLEVATGTGLIAFQIAPRAKSLVACDLSEEMIRVALEKLAASPAANLSFDVKDAYRLDYEPGSFDVVIASNALHIMTDPRRALDSVRAVLAPGGILIAPTFCHGNSGLSRIASAIMSSRGFKAHQKWSLEAARRFFEDAGFRMVEELVVRGIIPLLIPVLRAKEGQ
jgi:ubiquinone/menaquinone biosynthesis C-methylase UbiE